MLNHFLTSLIKSCLRILGFIVMYDDLGIGLTILVIAEIVGVVEEFVDKRKE